MIYLDNAATSFPKPRSVIKGLNKCIAHCGNPGRSSHTLSRYSEEILYNTREKISEHFNLNAPENVVFTYNATYALNIAIKSFITSKCHVIISDVEHNAVLRPIESLKKSLGIEYSIFRTDGNIEKNIKELIRADTRGIISTICSNVTGEAIALEILSKVARELGLFLIIDASQAVGHRKIDLSLYPCDAFCAPAHKGLLGIQGSGFCIFSDNKRRQTVIEGGSGTESINTDMPKFLPEGYEAGTVATPAIGALGCGIDYISRIGIDAIEEKITKLTNLTRDRLSDIKDVTLYPCGNGIVSFNILGYSAERYSSILDEKNIMCRGGVHCAPLAHKKLCTLDVGTVRISLSFFNTEREIDKLYKTIKKTVR